MKQSIKKGVAFENSSCIFNSPAERKMNAAKVETIYVADYLACTLVNGCLTKNDAQKLFLEHGSSYSDFVRDCGEKLNAKDILEWLGID